MRPLYFEFPELQGVWDAQPQWMLGDDLLVAPVLEPGSTSWPVLVPDGEWEDAWTGEVVTGPATIDVDTPIDRIPVFFRAESAERLRAIFGR
jgi:alpha-glucosidase (family GH31 glycosyl hydrolase)